MNGSLPSSSSSPASATPHETERPDLPTQLSRARAVLADGLHRLEMAQSDARGENHTLDTLDASLHADSEGAEAAGRARARKIAASVAEDLEAAAARLRKAAQG
jgi:hypothetical protein